MDSDPNITEFSRIESFLVEDVQIVPRQLLLKSPRGETSVEPKVMALLVTLAERESDTWTRTELIDKIWGTEFGGDESLTRAVYGLRKALSEPHGLQKAIKTLPKVGYRLDARVTRNLGKPVKQAANQPDVTEVPGPLSKPDPSATNITTDTSRSVLFDRRRLLMAGGAAALAGSVLGLRQILRAPNSAPVARNSLVVLPFVNDTGDQELDYLASGVSGEIRHSLSRNQALNILARRSSEAIKKDNLSLEDISEEFGSAFILDGRLTRTSGQLRLSTELIESQTGVNRWSDTFDAPKERLPTLQSAVTGEVTREITRDIDADIIADLGLPTNPAAFDIYLRAKAQWQVSFTAEAALVAVRIMDGAIELDPDFALAHTSKAFWLAWASSSVDDEGLSSRYLQEALASAKMAVELESELADAHSALGWVRCFSALDIAGAAQPFKRSLELAPNDAVILARYTYYIVMTGAMEDAQRTIQTAILLDPLNPSVHRTAAMIHYYAGQPELTLASADEIMKIQKNSVTAQYWKGRAHIKMGDAKIGIEACELSPNADERLPCQGIGYARLGQADAAYEAIDTLKQVYGEKAAYQQAQIYAALGEDDNAIEALQLAWDKRDAGLVSLKVDPVFTSLRNRQEFLYLLQSIGFDT